MIGIRDFKNLEELLLWRKEVIENVFGIEPDADLMEENKEYYLNHWSPESHHAHLAVLATVDGTDAGCGSICFSEELPSPDNPSGKCAYLMNIYVRTPFRQHGVAHSIVRHLIEKAKARGCYKIYLETTPEGRPVYESLGFHDLPDMMKLS